MNTLPDNNQTLDAIAKLQEKRQKIVFTNGCFDVLHIGHIRYLAEAKSLGDYLVIGLNSDKSVQRLKGSTRPINAQDTRKEMLLALRSIDFVINFEEDTPLELIHQVKPSVLVKGGDWAIDQIVGSNFVLSNGGEVKSLSFTEGYSSTSIIERIAVDTSK